ncbi:MAG: ABC transporter ATP-binding protein [Candidatus Sumerlaeia bacterium]|nr:ABC transporter ATP-binding protein [Candidatus Sumerlaeia bacterium]
MTPPVALYDVSKWYGEVLGINGITVQLTPGVTGLLGPNGAGKSTLLKVTAGLLWPSRGRVEIFGANPWREVEVYRRIGFCHDGDGFYDALTGADFLCASLRMHGYARQRARALAYEALELVGLADEARKRIGAYSKGMRQRLKLAHAVAHNPDVILLDEPLAGMDPVGRRHTLDLVARWGAEGKTVAISSHILHEIDALTSNIMMISHGRLLAEGDVHEVRGLLREHPHQIYLECAEPRALASRLIAVEQVRQVSLDSTRRGILIETFDPDAVYDRLTQVVIEDGVSIDLMTSPDDNVQAVFAYLTRGRSDDSG